MTKRQRTGCFALAMVGLLWLQGSANAQSVVIAIREPAVGNPQCNVKVTLNVIDDNGNVYGPYYPANGTYNFTMPAVTADSKRVSFQFQRVVGTTNLTVRNLLAAAQSFDLVIPTTPE